ncbi:MAG: baseplate J/gp47 family protein [Saprospiraceae bacterium]|nr:baseplate J/gp47 family protein [Saprospiraceae bacterium]
MPDFSDKEYYGVDSKHGFFRLRLNADFGHKKHLEDLVDYLAKKANPDANISGNAHPPTFAPYTPVLEEISLSFMARQDIGLDANADFQQRKGRFFHLHPFGYMEAHASLDENGQLPSLLPRYVAAVQAKADDPCLPTSKPPPPPADTSPAQHEAEFYIGIVDLKPPQNLSILFQMAEGSANPKILKPDDHVRWSYLSKNKWVAFRRDELNDRTSQLMRSGIITFSVPRDATNDNTLLPTGQFWLRASIARSLGNSISTTDAVCKIVHIAAQAARATFLDKGNSPDFLRTQLPAKTIAKLVVPEAEVKKVEQTFPSFGGRAGEEASHFYTRVSERLRHKKRAITAWDYERLVLEAFPNIYKVKCLNHTWFEPRDTGQSKYHELSPQHVTFIAIPNLQNHNAIDPLRPYTSLGDLKAIEVFLKKHLSCHVKLHVHNPEFEEVQVEFCVKFFAGVDEAFHLKLLNDELVRFLSPWAFGGGKDISFGGRTHKSSLINFIEERSYVDYVTDFKLYHLIKDAQGKDWSKVDQEQVEATKAISILVSAEKHTIKAIPATVTDMASEHCNC